MALLTALALIIFTLESFIPVPLPIPGMDFTASRSALHSSCSHCSGKHLYRTANGFLLQSCRRLMLFLSDSTLTKTFERTSNLD